MSDPGHPRPRDPSADATADLSADPVSVPQADEVSDPNARAASVPDHLGRGGTPRPPVVVVGLGPVGATVALLVARAGAPVVAVERDVEVYPHPRAVALDDDALRVLHAAGVRAGRELDVLPGGIVRIRGRGGRPLVELGPPPTTTGHPGLAFFRQPQLERALRAALEAEPLVDLRLGTTVERVADPGAADRDATLRVRDRDGTTSTLRASWVLACDGARSGIREALGVRLRGRSSPSRWLVVDTDATADPGHDARDGGTTAAEDGATDARGRAASDRAGGSPTFVAGDFEFGADPRGPWVHGPLPGGAHRWEVLLPRGTGREEAVAPAAARELLARRRGGPVPPVRRAAVYAFHARVAARLRVGRVLLLGDAAHLSPPFAGQGLCAGLRDAGNVGWKVAAAWAGTADGRLLDTYARERLPHVLPTTALALGLGLVVELRRTRAARVRDAVLRRVTGTRPVRRWIAAGGWRPSSDLRGGLVARSPAHRRHAGRPLPQPVPLDDRLPVGWVLLGATDAGPLASRGVAAVPWSTLPPGAAVLRRDLADVVLVRPDRVVFGTARADRARDLLAEAATTTALRGRR